MAAQGTSYSGQTAQIQGKKRRSGPEFVAPTRSAGPKPTLALTIRPLNANESTPPKPVGAVLVLTVLHASYRLSFYLLFPFLLFSRHSPLFVSSLLVTARYNSFLRIDIFFLFVVFAFDFASERDPCLLVSSAYN